METIDNKGSVLKLSLLALAIVAVAGCSSGGSSSQPIDQGDPGQTDGGGGGETDGGGTDSGSGSDGGDQDFTYRTINSASDIPAGEDFALDTTTIKATPRADGSNGATINAGPTIGARAIITVLNEDANGNTRIRLQDSENGVDTTLVQDGNGSNLYLSNGGELEIFSQGQSVSSLMPSGGLNYAAYGFWSVPDGSSDLNVGFFAGGYATQNGDMPITGTASFSGAANGFSVTSNGEAVDVIGNASMNVDFAAGTLTGAMTNMTSGANVGDALSSTTPWNDVGFSGTLTDNAFSADARVTSSPNNAAALDADAAGNINGRFYGPQAAEAAGTWSLEDGSGGAAFGGFGVKQ
ncbi:transferrin-binding protein-like solute binding protein [Vreelandella alkaliphila]|uniref:transferrin-binding protein-like solute binding protein n=1 Tax=Vreelandella alkaliphila TaxID=272774 RepID=UPI003FD73209